MPYCRIHGLHASESGCPTCRRAEYERQKAAEKIQEWLSNHEPSNHEPSNHGAGCENLFADLGTKIGAICGASTGIYFIIKGGSIGQGLVISVICAILGAIFGAVVGGFLPYILVLALLGALVRVILWIFDIK